MENKKRPKRIYNEEILVLIEESERDIEVQDRMKNFLEQVERGELVLSEGKNDRIFPWNHVLDCKDFILS